MAHMSSVLCPWRYPEPSVGPHRGPSLAAHSIRAACTKAWGKLPQLVLADVELLGQEAGGPGAVRARSNHRSPWITSPASRQAKASQKLQMRNDPSASPRGEPRLPVAIDEIVLGQAVATASRVSRLRRSSDPTAPRIWASSRAASTRGSSGGPLPTSGIVHAVFRRRGQDAIGQSQISHGPGRRSPGLADGPEPSDTDETAVRPVSWFDLPNPRIGLDPPALNGTRRRTAASHPGASSRSRDRGYHEEEKRLTEGVELNWSRTWFPTTSVPPGYPGRSSVSTSGTGRPSGR